MKKSNAFVHSIATLVVVLVFLPNSSLAQTVFDFSGRIYADYSYTVKSPDEEAEGDNVFGYRRMYFTANFKQSDKISGRFRLEANDGQTTAQGRPSPFVKDMYLKWNGALGDGHDVIAGVSTPPSWEVSEKVWGYRSLTKSLQDRGKILSSRDMGVGVRGTLSPDGSLKYGVMVANNEGVSKETDKHKRVYGQLEFYPNDQLSFTVGSDFASFEDGSAVNVNAFAGFTSDMVRAGIEGYVNPKSIDGISHDMIRSGLSAFVVAKISERADGIIRVDLLKEDFMGSTETETMLLAGFGLQAGPGVQLIPNIVVIDHSEDNDQTITGRITLYVDIG